MSALSLRGQRNLSGSYPLQVELVSSDQLATCLRDNNVLTVVAFGGENSVDYDDPRKIKVGLQGLSGVDQLEVWRGVGPVVSGQSGCIRYSRSDEILFGHLQISERPRSDITVAIQHAYRVIGSFLLASGYQYPFRLWNYIPDINRVENGVERYKSFCVGRHAAVSGAPGFERSLPAASAIGTTGASILISFLASRVRPVQIENPRQVSAFHYPAIYSPRSPLFSRAVRLKWENGPQLYLSGTASIVGHETKHCDNVIGQTIESIRNIDAVLQNGGCCGSNEVGRIISSSRIRVYLRQPEKVEAVRCVIQDQLGCYTPVVYLRGDICRSNLLVEIEGVFDLEQAII